MLASLRRRYPFIFSAKLAGAAQVQQEGLRCYYGGQQQPRQQQRREERGDTRQEKHEWWAVDGELFTVEDFNPKKLLEPLPNLHISNKRRRHDRFSRLNRTRLKLRSYDQESYWRSYMLRYQIMRDEWEKLYWDPPELRSTARMQRRGHKDIEVDASKGLRFLGRQFDRMGGPGPTSNDKVPLWGKWPAPQRYESRGDGRLDQHHGNRRDTWVKQNSYNDNMNRLRDRYNVKQRDTIEQHSVDNRSVNGWPSRPYKPYDNMQSQQRTNNNDW